MMTSFFMSSHSMDETYGQQICLHLFDYSYAILGIFVKKLQLKWSPTLYCHMAQVVHFEKLKLNNK